MKKRYLVLIIVIVVLAVGALTVKILFSKAETELKQLANTEIESVDMSSAEDGVYTGSYSAFPVSAEVSVTIKDHKIEKIDIIKHNNGQGEEAEIIPDKVTEAQSLDVDSVSGATYSSKVILKAIQNALLDAGAEPL